MRAGLAALMVLAMLFSPLSVTDAVVRGSEASSSSGSASDTSASSVPGESEPPDAVSDTQPLPDGSPSHGAPPAPDIPVLQVALPVVISMVAGSAGAGWYGTGVFRTLCD